MYSFCRHFVNKPRWRLLIFNHCSVVTSTGLFWRFSWIIMNDNRETRFLIVLLSIFTNFIILCNIFHCIRIKYVLLQRFSYVTSCDTSFFLINISIKNVCFSSSQSIILAMTDWLAKFTVSIKCEILLPLPIIRERRWFVLFRFQRSGTYRLRWPPWWTSSQNTWPKFYFGPDLSNSNFFSTYSKYSDSFEYRLRENMLFLDRNLQGDWSLSVHWIVSHPVPPKPPTVFSFACIFMKTIPN